MTGIFACSHIRILLLLSLALAAVYNQRHQLQQPQMLRKMHNTSLAISMTAAALPTDTDAATDERFRASLKRVNTQQESLKKSVAEALTNAKDKGDSFNIATAKSSLLQQSQQDKAAAEAEEQRSPGIGARYTKPSSIEEQPESSTPNVGSAAVQQVQDQGAENRAESLPEQTSRDQVAPQESGPMQSVAEGPAIDLRTVQQDETPELPSKSAGDADLINNPDVQARRLDLSKMQVALGHVDTSAPGAAFDSRTYHLGYLPSSGGGSFHAA